MALRRLLADKGFEPTPQAVVDEKGIDLLPPGRQLVNNREVEVSVENQRQRARDRRRAHDEHVGVVAFGAQRRALLDAEALLLVADDKPKRGKIDALRQHRVRSDDHLRRSVCDGRSGRAALRGRHFAGDEHRSDTERLKQPFKRRVMLRR